MIEYVYRLSGCVLAVVALANLRDRKWKNAAFWAAFATTLLCGTVLPNFVNGCLVIVLVLVGARGLERGKSMPPKPARGNRVFLPALLVPALTLIGTLVLRRFDPKNASLLALAAAAMIALATSLVMFREGPSTAARETRRLMDLVGWAAVLPQMLAALGALFTAAGVGKHVADILEHVSMGSLDRRAVAVSTYTVGMALFTMVMGNAFAAFPVMTAAVAIPVLVKKLGGDPAATAALGMLSGFCGTLMTPMAANFNLVPAALLELPNENAVIRVQVPTALVLLFVNTVLMYFLAFR